MGDTIDFEDLPQSVRRPDNQKNGGAAATAVGSIDSPPSFEAHEKEHLTNALEQAGGNQSEAARILRVSPDRMRDKMSKHNLR